jgi:hypothetical protein
VKLEIYPAVTKDFTLIIQVVHPCKNISPAKGEFLYSDLNKENFIIEDETKYAGTAYSDYE